MNLWQLLIFPFTRLSAAFKRRYEEGVVIHAERKSKGLCLTCGTEPPYEGEDECPACDLIGSM